MFRRGLQAMRHRIKSDPRLLELAKRARGMLVAKGRGEAPAAPADE